MVPTKQGFMRTLCWSPGKLQVGFMPATTCRCSTRSSLRLPAASFATAAWIYSAVLSPGDEPYRLTTMGVGVQAMKMIRWVLNSGNVDTIPTRHHGSIGTAFPILSSTPWNAPRQWKLPFLDLVPGRKPQGVGRQFPGWTPMDCPSNCHLLVVNYLNYLNYPIFGWHIIKLFRLSFGTSPNKKHQNCLTGALLDQGPATVGGLNLMWETFPYFSNVGVSENMAYCGTAISMATGWIVRFFGSLFSDSSAKVMVHHDQMGSNLKQPSTGYGSIPIDTFLVGWTSIYQLFWGSLGTRVLTHPQLPMIRICIHHPSRRPENTVSATLDSFPARVIAADLAGQPGCQARKIWQGEGLVVKPRWRWWGWVSLVQSFLLL